MDLCNRNFVRLAQSLEKPIISVETATLSRIRPNYIDDAPDNQKHIRPQYYRMSLNSWIYDRGTWLTPGKLFKLRDRIKLFTENFNHYHEAGFNPKKHTWKNNPNGYILLLGQLEHDPTSQRLVGEWLEETVERIQSVTKRDIKFKPHPYTVDDYSEFCQANNVELLSNEIKTQDLYEDIYAAVVDNSTSVFELLDAGIPVFCGESSFAAPIGNTDVANIESPNYINSRQYFNWLCQMCFTEFSLVEMQEPTIVEVIQQFIDQHYNKEIK